ncbi:hypothetical protein PsorP6_012010 [Peronosclerospora sorghi]|uniref:Uncharacterized protein n=1 Tax=Peronosclerospora sorghi TaxID=230839 RepID=A0ACC0WKX6_9STRA|nr:hypothetical protein PsorP6_012010 [Peronosclerospora sorghi]
MLFLDRVLSSALNVSRLLLERDNVTMVLDLLHEVKHLVVLQGPNDLEKEYIVAPAADVQAELEAYEDENCDVDDDDRDDENDRIRHNEAIIPNLHASGIVYYLLRFARDVDEMSIAARLISQIHLRQSGLDVPHRNEGKQKGELSEECYRLIH